MTGPQLKSYLVLQAEILKIPVEKLSEKVDSVIQIGLEAFWNAYPWSWRCKQGEIPITSSVESYDLPKDFAKIKVVRDKSPYNGRKLRFLPLELFRDRFPRPDYIAATDPRWYTIIKPATGDVWKIHFFPFPTARTIYVDYLTDTPPTIDKVPGESIDCLSLLCESKLHASGSDASLNSRKVYIGELQRLQVNDGPYGGFDAEMKDEDDSEMEGRPLWWVPSQS